MRQWNEKLYKRAIALAKRKGRPDECYDFANWLAIEWLECRSQHQTLDQSFIEYLRTNHENPRSVGGLAKLVGKAATLSIIADSERAPGRAYRGTISERALGDELSNGQGITSTLGEDRVELRGMLDQVFGRNRKSRIERAMFILRNAWELNGISMVLKEAIATLLGVGKMERLVTNGIE